MLANICQEEQL